MSRTKTKNPTNNGGAPFSRLQNDAMLGKESANCVWLLTLIEVTQSSVLDSIISREVDYCQPLESPQQLLTNMTKEDRKMYVRELIEIGETLLGTGRYAPRDIKKSSIMKQLSN